MPDTDTPYHHKYMYPQNLTKNILKKFKS